ncbi:MAG TPA: hypothetical protein DDW76_01150 [Cyanobacteria bacterium UBA11369]|nr:hypothetical protein [Cyanobacteria bacterium UBA11371]HBE36154.1 hypothetical protein [Cyanobacteria bacterium UBA11368]HBE47441.1 hypothetical protein [Cyanobacteria bacterium UBA11369]
MRLELKRIEATLQQIAAQNAATGEQPSASPKDRTKEDLSSGETAKKVLRDPLSELKLRSQSAVVPADAKSPALPKVKQPTFSSHRHGINPNLPMTLLKEIEATVAGWQAELKQILQQIQEVYLEGPVIEGWLESAEEGKPQESAAVNASPNPFFRGYRLCGLDKDGKLWSRSVTPQQLPEVSLAIARYQKLKQFLTRKQELEHRLNELAEMLILVQGHLQKL